MASGVDPVLEGFRRLQGTVPYKAWRDSSPGAWVDAEKLDKKSRGVSSPKPGSGYALSLWRMLDGIRPPLPPSPPLDPIWQFDGVLNVNLSAWDGPRRMAAWEVGFRWFAPIFTHNPAVVRNIGEYTDLKQQLRAWGWRIGGWGTYGQSAPSPADALTAVDLVRSLGLEFWIANGEAWAEEEHVGETKEFLDTWRAKGSPVPLAFSCNASETGNFCRPYDFASILANPGSAVMPQVYGNENLNLTVGAEVMSLGQCPVPLDRVNMTFGTYVPQGRAREVIPWDNYRTWKGPRSIYFGEGITAAEYARLAR